MNTPSDEEIVALARSEGIKVRTGAGVVKLARAVLAKWGTPQPENLGFTIENRAGADVVVWKEGGCRPATSAEIAMWKALSAVQQPVAREQLSANQVSGLAESAGYWHGDMSRADFINGIRYAEAAHGIKGGQHG